MRGEDVYSIEQKVNHSGSPPHARGRRDDSDLRLSYRGITPACAGKTRKKKIKWNPSKDHPRMRGEDGW